MSPLVIEPEEHGADAQGGCHPRVGDMALGILKPLCPGQEINGHGGGALDDIVLTHECPPARAPVQIDDVHERRKTPRRDDAWRGPFLAPDFDVAVPVGAVVRDGIGPQAPAARKQGWGIVAPFLKAQPVLVGELGRAAQ